MPSENEECGAFFVYNSPLVLTESIFLFLYFINMTVKSTALGRTACFLAPCSLGVLMIHLNDLIKPVWIDALHPDAYANSPWMLPYLLFCTAAVYGLCVAADLIRRWLFRPLNKMTWPDRLLGRVNAMLERLDLNIH